MTIKEELSLSVERNDLYLKTFRSLKIANQVRNHLLLKFKPKTWIFVVKSIALKNGWDIFISNEYGGKPSNKHLEKIKKFTLNYMKEIKK